MTDRIHGPIIRVLAEIERQLAVSDEHGKKTGEHPNLPSIIEIHNGHVRDRLKELTALVADLGPPDGFYDAWDALNSAATAILICQPAGMTAAAARLDAARVNLRDVIAGISAARPVPPAPVPRLPLETMTDREVVTLAFQLARELLQMRGYGITPGYRFDLDPPERTRTYSAWAMTCRAFELLRGTEVENALAALDDDEIAAAAHAGST